MPPQKPQDVGILDAISFFVELAMVVLLVFAGHGIAGGWRGWALGAFLAFVAIGIWAQRMAPTSDKRLDNPTRFIVQAMMFATVGLYAAAAGLTWWGIGFAVIAIAVFGTLARRDH